MSLHIIIDGYNLIRQSPSLAELDFKNLELGREALIRRLATYKKWRPHKVTIVFDGTNAPLTVQHYERMAGIHIRFSRPGELADTVIKKMAKEERERAVVVSSDKDITNYAAKKGAAIMSAEEFDEKLVMVQYTELNGCETTDEQPGWIPTTVKKGPRRRLSKKARKNKQKTTKI